MTAGTIQYTSEASLATLSGDTDLTVTAATDKTYLVDPTGARNLDLIAVDTSETGVTTSRFQIQIVNQCTNGAAETITVRDGNNSDTLIGIVEEDHGVWCEFNGTRWTATSGAT
tara:strand:- start:82 stop:423 length:342 start_codon:yes stop_codon:yes gene_type:complete